MKSSIFILICLFLIQVSPAQNVKNDSLNHLLAEEGTEWSIGSFSDNPTEPDFSFRMKMQGDTLINDTAYHKLYRLSPHEGVNTWQACSFVRIDNDSLLYYRDTINREVLVFDFKLSLGDDSVFLHPVVNGTWDETMLEFLSDAEITNTSSMMIQGEEKMSWEISPGGTTWGTWWTEGLGPHSGLWTIHMNLTGMVGLTHILLCAYQNGELIYNNPDYSHCEYTDIQQKTQKSLRFHPNPFSDYLCIDIGSNAASTQIFLLDMQGRIVMQKNTTTPKTTLNTHNLPSGLYLLRTNTGYQRKVMKY